MRRQGGLDLDGSCKHVHVTRVEVSHANCDTRYTYDNDLNVQVMDVPTYASGTGMRNFTLYSNTTLLRTRIEITFNRFVAELTVSNKCYIQT